MSGALVTVVLTVIAILISNVIWEARDRITGRVVAHYRWVERAVYLGALLWNTRSFMQVVSSDGALTRADAAQLAISATAVGVVGAVWFISSLFHRVLSLLGGHMQVTVELAGTVKGLARAAKSPDPERTP